jgi:hypothetical protein
MNNNPQTDSGKNTKDSLFYFIKDIFSLDKTAIIVFCIMLLLMCCFGVSKECDKIFKENSQKRHLQQIIINDVKNHKNITLEDSISNVQKILVHHNTTETEVSFTCKIIYPLTTRGITNDEEISTTLIIKSTLLIYLIIKCLSLLLQAIGVSIWLDSLVSICYCSLAMRSAEWTTKGRDSLVEALKKKDKLIKKYMAHGTSKAINTAELKGKLDELTAEDIYYIEVGFKILKTGKHCKQSIVLLTASTITITDVRGYFSYDTLFVQKSPNKLYYTLLSAIDNSCSKFESLQTMIQKKGLDVISKNGKVKDEVCLKYKRGYADDTLGIYIFNGKIPAKFQGVIEAKMNYWSDISIIYGIKANNNNLQEVEKIISQIDLTTRDAEGLV